jgi:hypothetical protein
METAKVAKALEGERLYQQRARIALPILVRQAHAGAKIYYEELAAELGMPNPRNLNYPLGSIGTALEELSKVWKQEIPQIQCLVVNQRTGLPGEGVGRFVRDAGEFKGLPLRKRRAIVDAVLAKVFAYPYWNKVLDTFDLKPATTGYECIIESAAKYQGGGESDLHKALKRFVAENPRVIDLPGRAGIGELEHALPSGDSIDVFFYHACIRTAVEVKSRISDHADIARGLFQCVKYRAVLDACVAAENSDDSTEAVLVLEGGLPDDLRALRNILDVKIVEHVRGR